MPTVEVSFTALRGHGRTARLVATAVARGSGVGEALLDEVRLAVGEACSRAVEAHRQHCPAEPVRIALTDQAGRFEVEVTDTGRPQGFGLAVIAELADDVQISETSAGTSIKMSWPSWGCGPDRLPLRLFTGSRSMITGGALRFTDPDA